MSHLGNLIQAHIDSADYAPSARTLAKRIGISPTAFGHWRTGGLKRLPAAENLRAAARVLGVPYSHVLRAALLDADYLEDEVMGNALHPAPIDKVKRSGDPGTRPGRVPPLEEVEARDDSDLHEPAREAALPQPPAE